MTLKTNLRILFAAGTLSLIAIPVTGISHPGKAGEPVDIAEAQARAAKRFSDADSNGDGQITEAEFMAIERDKSDVRKGKRAGKHRGRHQRNLTDEQRAALQDDVFEAADLNGDGQLSRSEASPQNMRQARRGVMRKAMFAHLDTDGNGVLSSEEMPDRTARMRAADSNGDGKLSRDEMKAARKARRASQG